MAVAVVTCHDFCRILLGRQCPKTKRKKTKRREIKEFIVLFPPFSKKFPLLVLSSHSILGLSLIFHLVVWGSSQCKFKVQTTLIGKQHETR